MWFFWMDPRFEALRSNASTRGSFIQSEVVEALEKKNRCTSTPSTASWVVTSSSESATWRCDPQIKMGKTVCGAWARFTDEARPNRPIKAFDTWGHFKPLNWIACRLPSNQRSRAFNYGRPWISAKQNACSFHINTKEMDLGKLRYDTLNLTARLKWVWKR